MMKPSFVWIVGVAIPALALGLILGVTVANGFAQVPGVTGRPGHVGDTPQQPVVVRPKPWTPVQVSNPKSLIKGKCGPDCAQIDESAFLAAMSDLDRLRTENGAQAAQIANLNKQLSALNLWLENHGEYLKRIIEKTNGAEFLANYAKKETGTITVRLDQRTAIICDKLAMTKECKL